jgi:hypothetical protein
LPPRLQNMRLSWCSSGGETERSPQASAGACGHAMKVQRRNRRITPLFMNPVGVDGQRHALTALTLWKISGTHLTGGWVGPMAGLVECGKSPSHRDLIPVPPSL